MDEQRQLAELQQKMRDVTYELGVRTEELRSVVAWIQSINDMLPRGIAAPTPIPEHPVPILS